MPPAHRDRPVFFKRVSFVSLFKILIVIALIANICACSSSRSQKRGASMSTAGKEAAQKPEDQQVIGSSENDRPGMKDAGQEAEKDPNDQRIVDGEDAEKRSAYEEDDTGIPETGVALGVMETGYVEYDEYGEPIEPQQDEPVDEDTFEIGLVGGYGLLSGDEIDGYPIVGLAIGATSKTKKVGGTLRLTFGFPRLTDATGISEGIKGESELSIEGLFRLYTTPIHTFVGFCFIGGVRWSMLNWEYENPIAYDDGYGNLYEIYGDNLQSLSPFLGIGLNLVQTRRLVIGSDLTAGYKIYKWNTEEGFDNDVLDDEWVFQLMIDAMLVFGR